MLTSSANDSSYYLKITINNYLNSYILQILRKNFFKWVRQDPHILDLGLEKKD